MMMLACATPAQPHCSAHVAIKVVSEPRYFSAAVYESNITKSLEHPSVVKTTAWSVQRPFPCFTVTNRIRLASRRSRRQ